MRRTTTSAGWILALVAVSTACTKHDEIAQRADGGGRDAQVTGDDAGGGELDGSLSSDGGVSSDGSVGDAGPAPDGGVGALSCNADPAIVFPALSKACVDVRECTTIFHQIDCCGNEVAIGLVHGQTAQEAAEAQCRDAFPGCGCPAGPTRAEDGMTTLDRSTIRVACDDGQCRTHVVPEMSACGSGEPSYPGVSKAGCDVDADCTAVLHQSDCCGSLTAIGIMARDVATYQAYEDDCAGLYPDCDCVSQPTRAQDDNTTTNHAQLRARCVDHVCMAVVAPDDVCGDDETCANGFSCCYPCGIPGCENRCEPSCTGGEGSACFDGCIARP